MRKISPLKLTEKGWSNLEIKRAQRILERSSQQDLFFSKIVFWTAMIVIIFANFIVSLSLVPFLLVLSKTLLYGIIILLVQLPM